MGVSGRNRYFAETGLTNANFMNFLLYYLHIFAQPETKYISNETCVFYWYMRGIYKDLRRRVG